MFRKKEYVTLNRIAVSQQALRHNFSFIQNMHPEALVAPVLKSNAYGHGLTTIAPYIAEKLKPPFICVDSLYEAYQLEKIRIKTPILILGYTHPTNYKLAKRLKQFSFPVFDLETMDYLNQYQKGAKVHLKIDTGMNRLGIQPDRVGEWLENLPQYKNIEVEGIYSHLSQADDPKKTAFTQKQITQFKSVIRAFETAGIRFKWKHIAATAGALTIIDPEFNLIRLGLGFYGYSPFKVDKKLKPALSLTTTLAQIKKVRQGSEISYSGTHITKKPTVIGILPIGYYDGLDRRLSNKGTVMVNSTPCPILGRVCMNITIIDLSRVENPRVGDEVEIISPTLGTPNSLENMAKLSKTIPYDLLVKLSETTRRELVI